MKLTIIPFLLLLALATASAQQLPEARQLATSGKHAEAEQLYSRLLEKDPDNLQALLGAGYNYSWSRQFAKAKKSFDAALALAPNHPDALVGKGYTLAWAGEYAGARSQFQALEKLDPENWEAKKGIAYVCLWQGDGQAAISYFSDLVLVFPRELEYYIALAQAHLLEGEVRDARIALQSGLLIEPSNAVALELLTSTYSQAAMLDLDVLAGYSVAEDMDNFGLRTVQLSGNVTKNLRMFLRYDNSLSLDLASLVRKNQEAQAFTLGGVLQWQRKFVTRLDYGVRQLPDHVTQQVISGEQVVFLPKGLSFKLGGFTGFSDKLDTEWLAYGSFRLPVTTHYAIEPYYFHSKVEHSGKPESRFMLNNQLRFTGGYEANLGFFYGKAAIREENGSDSIMGGYLSTVLPFNKFVWGLASLRMEKAPFNKLTAASIGLKMRLER